MLLLHYSCATTRAPRAGAKHVAEFVASARYRCPYCRRSGVRYRKNYSRKICRGCGKRRDSVDVSLSHNLRSVYRVGSQGSVAGDFIPADCAGPDASCINKDCLAATAFEYIGAKEVIRDVKYPGRSYRDSIVRRVERLDRIAGDIHICPEADHGAVVRDHIPKHALLKIEGKLIAGNLKIAKVY